VTTATTAPDGVATAGGRCPPAWPGIAAQALAGMAGRATAGTAAGTSPPVLTGLAEDGSAVVARRHAGTVAAALADAARCHADHGGRPAVAAAYSRLAGLLDARLATTIDQDAPGPGGAGGTVRDASGAAAVKWLDGTSRARLLSWLADTDPALVAGGLAWLAAEHAASEERARLRRNRRATLRSRRRRAARAAAS